MEVKVTSKKSGLEIGTYDLCKTAAENLIGRGLAVLVETEVAKIPDVTDFSGYTDDQIAGFAVKAELPANITNRKTIVKRLTEMEFVPDTEE